MKRFMEFRSAGILAMCIFMFLFVIACDENDDDITGPDNTPTPTVVPTITPTPSGAWGYTSGHAEIMLTNLPPEPEKEKEVLFCMGNPDNKNWMNVRYRSDRKFQIKGGLDPDTDCVDEYHITLSQSAGEGTWVVDWTEDGHITVRSPTGGSETIHVPGGKYAFRHICQGSCGGYIPYGSSASIEVLSFTGTVGYGTGCSL